MINGKDASVVSNQCQMTLGINFNDNTLLLQALTHSSFANEQHDDVMNNERLEFLGDAVLELVISEYLFKGHPDLREGELTRMRAVIVQKHTLADAAKTLGLGDHIALGKGEIVSGGRQRPALLADAFEAVIGAVYLDQGLKTAKKFILKHLQKPIEACERGNLQYNYKTKLQEHIQSLEGHHLLCYDLVNESGPDHAKEFEVGLWLDDKLLTQAKGFSKKEAEQQAAKKALQKLQIDR